MAYSQDEAIKLAKAFLEKASKRHQIHSAYLFGSYARGNQKDYSDIDIAVILGNVIQAKKYYEEAFEIFHEAQEYNSILEVLCFREDEFEKNGQAIIAQIKREGLKICI